jgi:hypothetical protein
MKKTLLLVQVLSLTFLTALNSGCTEKKGGSPDQPYGEKSGIVTYKPMEMMGVKVNQTIFFDDYGKKEMREVTVEGNMMGMDMRQHTIDIRDGSITYHYELENISGGEDRATKNVTKSTFTPEMAEQMNVANLSEAMKTKLKFKEEGTETVAGLKGTKFSMAPDSTNPQNIVQGVHYKNIPLKLKAGPMEMVVEKVELGANIPADKFKIPAGYTIVDEAQGQMPQMPAEQPGTNEEPK